MRHLQELYLQYKDQGLVILGFNASDDKQIALDFMHENGATFPTILDSSDAAVKVAFHDYRGSGVPLNYIIDRDGNIVDAWYGYEAGHPRAIAALQKMGGKLAKAIRPEIAAKTAQSADEVTAALQTMGGKLADAIRGEVAAKTEQFAEEVTAALQKMGGKLAKAIRPEIAAKTAQSADEVTAAARRLFDAIRAADYDHDWISTGDWKGFPAKDVEYNVDHNMPGWVSWVCAKFKANPITDVQLGKVFPSPGGLPTVHFELRLKDGEILQGDLPFQWDSQKKQWIGQEGLDWHLHNAP